MEPVLIYTDTERIEKEQDFLDEAVVYLQQLYDAFKAIGITVSTSEMNAITQSACSHSDAGKRSLLNLVTEKLLDIAGEPNFNGVPIMRSKLKELISVPELSGIESIISEFKSQTYRPGNSIRVNLLSLAADVISKTAGADTALAEEFTYYTKTDRSSEFATHLTTLKTALENWEQSYTNQMGMNRRYGHVHEVVPGIMYMNNKFELDWKFIRQREAVYS